MIDNDGRASHVTKQSSDVADVVCTEWTDEAVEDALGAMWPAGEVVYSDEFPDAETGMRAALNAAITRTPSVRQLDWQETLVDRGDGSEEPNGWEADTGFGLWYDIEQYFGSDSYGWLVTFDCNNIGDFDDPDQAKACAQSDFEKRIKAQLSTDPGACPTENFLPSSLNNSLPQSLTSVSKKAGT